MKQYIQAHLLSLGGYKDWDTKPELPIEVTGHINVSGMLVVTGKEMKRIGYHAAIPRTFSKSEFISTEMLAKLKPSTPTPAAAPKPARKVRTPRRRNPQAICHVDQLERGIFRVNGLMEGKARICHVHLSTTHARFVPINPSLPSQTFTLGHAQSLLNQQKLSIMCMERFD